MIIRDATPADRAFVLDLAKRLVTFEIPSWRTPDEIVDGDRRALEAWFDDPAEDQAMLVAELDGQRAGCALLVTLIDYFNERPHAHLSVLAVTAAAEGRGVGSALLDRSVEWARQRGSDRLTLSALVTNTRARRLYERRGFAGEYIRYVLKV
jgi:ribosomal protein S18 acetylase RimI-like enzyme